jgi:hypothetical protein
MLEFWKSDVQAFALITISLTTISHTHFFLYALFSTFRPADHAPGKRAIWIKETVPLDLNFLIWLQCEWFGCGTEEALQQVQF